MAFSSRHPSGVLSAQQCPEGSDAVGSGVSLVEWSCGSASGSMALVCKVGLCLRAQTGGLANWNRASPELPPELPVEALIDSGPSYLRLAMSGAWGELTVRNACILRHSWSQPPQRPRLHLCTAEHVWRLDERRTTSIPQSSCLSCRRPAQGMKSYIPGVNVVSTLGVG